jgi:D-3-phosphoglycerate dehydrogenase
MVFLSYTDRPGIVGVWARSWAAKGSTSRACRSPGTCGRARALITLTVDSAIPPVVLEDITATIGAVAGRSVSLAML